MNNSKSIYWYDLETFGINSKRDRISQFAGIRTDEDLNIIDEPLIMYCKLSDEILPEPMSCLVTGILPDTVNEKGIPEPLFIEKILQQFIVPNTCVTGYNNIRFDDEFIRNTLYRNFYDPYEREWKNGNSRWDIIDMVRLTRAMRPSGIEWPTNDDGTPSFRLELLTAANGISHEAAHDAMSDVYATIELARLIKDKQSKLFKFVYENRSKTKISRLLDVRERVPVLHVSSKYSAEKSCIAVVAPIAMHPVNKNAIIVYDLSVDPRQLLELGKEEIKRLLFLPSEELNEGEERIPLKAVHINKCPVLVPLSTLDGESAKRLKIDLNICRQNLNTINNANKLHEKIRKLYMNPTFETPEDPEFKLYNGFFNDNDKRNMMSVNELAKNEKISELSDVHFEDQRLRELLIRFRARNFPDSLSDEEMTIWQEYRIARLVDDELDTLTLRAFREKIEELTNSQDLSEEGITILRKLREYGDKLESRLQIQA